jgi:hypothetical protein
VLRARLEAEGGEGVGDRSAEFARFLHDETTNWADVVNAAGLRTE